MGSSLRVLYVIACCFVAIFVIGITAHYGSLAPTLSQSRLLLIPFVAITSAIITVYISILAAAGVGMWRLYNIIFRRR